MAKNTKPQAKPNPQLPSDDDVIAALCAHSLGEISGEDAARILNLTPEQFLSHLQARPDLQAAADARVREDSTLAVERAVSGLNRGAAALAQRLESHGELSTTELVGIVDRLDKISALSKTREISAKASPEARAEDPLDNLWMSFFDTRPLPDGESLPTNSAAVWRWLFIRPGHPAREARKRDSNMTHDEWLNTFFPLVPGGKGKCLDLAEIAGVDFWIDAVGKKHTPTEQEG